MREKGMTELRSKAVCAMLLKKQDDARQSVKFIKWAEARGLLDARCKCYALQILTRFRLFNTALPLAKHLAASHQQDHQQVHKRENPLPFDFRGSSCYCHMSRPTWVVSHSSCCKIYDLI